MGAPEKASAYCILGVNAAMVALYGIFNHGRTAINEHYPVQYLQQNLRPMPA